MGLLQFFLWCIRDFAHVDALVAELTRRERWLAKGMIVGNRHMRSWSHSCAQQQSCHHPTGHARFGAMWMVRSLQLVELIFNWMMRIKNVYCHFSPNRYLQQKQSYCENSCGEGICVHYGLYCYIRMPIGLNVSPVTFHWSIELILSTFGCQHALVYLDAVVIVPKSASDHIGHVKAVQTLLHEADGTMKAKM